MNTPYLRHHYIAALLQCGLREDAIAQIKAYWGAMVDYGADTFWEIFDPAHPDFSPYGSKLINSYCHAWSCTRLVYSPVRTLTTTISEFTFMAETTFTLWRQRLGYGIADLSCNLVWQMISLYLMFFYTDVMGLPAYYVGLMFLVTRTVDGVADVLMGLVIDNTATRWGAAVRIC